MGTDTREKKSRSVGHKRQSPPKHKSGMRGGAEKLNFMEEAILNLDAFVNGVDDPIFKDTVLLRNVLGDINTDVKERHLKTIAIDENILRLIGDMDKTMTSYMEATDNMFKGDREGGYKRVLEYVEKTLDEQNEALVTNVGYNKKIMLGGDDEPTTAEKNENNKKKQRKAISEAVQKRMDGNIKYFQHGVDMKYLELFLNRASPNQLDSMAKIDVATGALDINMDEINKHFNAYLKGGVLNGTEFDDVLGINDVTILNSLRGKSNILSLRNDIDQSFDILDDIDLFNELLKKDADIETLKKQIERLKTQIDTQKKQIDAQKQTNVLNKERIEFLKQESDVANIHIKNLERILTNIEAYIGGKQATVENLDEYIKKIVDTEIRNAHDHYQGVIKTERDSMNKVLQEALDSNDTLKKQLEQQIIDKDRSNLALQEQLRDAQSDAQKSESALIEQRAVSENIIRQKEAAAENVNKKDAQIQELLKTLDNQQTEIVKQAQTIANTQSELSEATEKSNALSGKVTLLNARISELEVSNESFRDKISEKTAELDNLQVEKAALEKKLKANENAKISAATGSAENKNKIRDLESELIKKQDEIKLLEKELYDLKKQLDDINGQLTASKAEKETLNSDKIQAEETIRSLSSQLNELRSQQEALVSQRNTAELKITALEQSAKEKDEQIRLLKAEKQNSNKRNDEIARLRAELEKKGNLPTAKNMIDALSDKIKKDIDLEKAIIETKTIETFKTNNIVQEEFLKHLFSNSKFNESKKDYDINESSLNQNILGLDIYARDADGQKFGITNELKTIYEKFMPNKYYADEITLFKIIFKNEPNVIFENIKINGKKGNEQSLKSIVNGTKIYNDTLKKITVTVDKSLKNTPNNTINITYDNSKSISGQISDFTIPKNFTHFKQFFNNDNYQMYLFPLFFNFIQQRDAFRKRLEVEILEKIIRGEITQVKGVSSSSLPPPRRGPSSSSLPGSSATQTTSPVAQSASSALQEENNSLSQTSTVLGFTTAPIGNIGNVANNRSVANDRSLASERTAVHIKRNTNAETVELGSNAATVKKGQGFSQELTPVNLDDYSHKFIQHPTSETQGKQSTLKFLHDRTKKCILPGDKCLLAPEFDKSENFRSFRNAVHSYIQTINIDSQKSTPELTLWDIITDNYSGPNIVVKFDRIKRLIAVLIKYYNEVLVPNKRSLVNTRDNPLLKNYKNAIVHYIALLCDLMGIFNVKPLYSGSKIIGLTHDEYQKIDISDGIIGINLSSTEASSSETGSLTEPSSSSTSAVATTNPSSSKVPTVDLPSSSKIVIDTSDPNKIKLSNPLKTSETSENSDIKIQINTSSEKVHLNSSLRGIDAIRTLLKPIQTNPNQINVDNIHYSLLTQHLKNEDLYFNVNTLSFDKISNSMIINKIKLNKEFTQFLNNNITVSINKICLYYWIIKNINSNLEIAYNNKNEKKENNKIEKQAYDFILNLLESIINKFKSQTETNQTIDDYVITRITSKGFISYINKNLISKSPAWRAQTPNVPGSKSNGFAAEQAVTETGTKTWATQVKAKTGVDPGQTEGQPWTLESPRFSSSPSSSKGGYRYKESRLISDVLRKLNS